jgi:hypothetical protein
LAARFDEFEKKPILVIDVGTGGVGEGESSESGYVMARWPLWAEGVACVSLSLRGPDLLRLLFLRSAAELPSREATAVGQVAVPQHCASRGASIKLFAGGVNKLRLPSIKPRVHLQGSNKKKTLL